MADNINPRVDGAGSLGVAVKRWLTGFFHRMTFSSGGDVPSAGVAGHVQLYAKNDDKLYVMDSAGAETALGDPAGKADKVAAAVDGNLAGLDATGNLTDSGYSPASFDAAGSASSVAGDLTSHEGLGAEAHDLDQGTEDAYLNTLKFVTTPAAITLAEGVARWNTDDHTLELQTDVSDVRLQVGQELIIRVTNRTGSPMTNGQVVYISGAQGDRPKVTLAKADAAATSDKTLGVLTCNIANGADGYVTTFGLVRDLNTDAYTEGDELWLSAATAGAMTNVRPDAPAHAIRVGTVVRKSATVGVVQVDIDRGGDLSDLHDVSPTTPNDGEYLKFVASTGLWTPAAGGSGAGDVAGPGSAVSGNVASFSGTSGKIIADSGKAAASLVTGPASATNNNLVAFDLTTGKIIKDAGVSSSSFDAAGASAAVQSNLTAHTGNTSNPHSTTASQVGASATGHLHTGGDGTGKLLGTTSVTLSTNDRLLGRSTAGAGAAEEITCTAAGRALLDDATAAVQRDDTLGAKPYCGFVDRTSSALSVVGTDFTITPSPSFVFYVNGVKFTKSGTETVAVATDNTLHFVYYNASGVLSVSTSPWAISLTAAPVALVYKYGASYAIWDERHGYNRDLAWHSWAHQTIGTRYFSGLTGTFANSTFSVTQGVIADEDIQFDSGGTLTSCRLWYRQPGGAAMAFEAPVTAPYKAATGVLQFDNGGTLTSVTNNNFANVWVYATPDASYPIHIVVGQAQYATAAAADLGAVPTIPGLTTREWKLIYRAVYKQTAGGIIYDHAVDYRETSTGPSSAVSSGSHSLLTDRSLAGQHPASAISTDTTNFNKNLSAADDTVQKALETLDNLNTGGGGAAGPWTSWVGV